MEGLSLDARVVNTGSFKTNSANTLEAPGWTRLDIGTRYLLDVQGKLVTLRARIDNLADRKCAKKRETKRKNRSNDGANGQRLRRSARIASS